MSFVVPTAFFKLNATLRGDAREAAGRPGSGNGFLPHGVAVPRLLPVKLHLEKLPASLADQRETLARCLEAMNAAQPLRRVILFGSHARGDARPDSDVDLCLVADGAERQLVAAAEWRRSMRPVRPKLSFTLIPITPTRLREKQSCRDFFFATVMREGVLLATEN